MCTYDDYTFMNSVRKRGEGLKENMYRGNMRAANLVAEVATNDDKVCLTLTLRKPLALY